MEAGAVAQAGNVGATLTVAMVARLKPLLGEKAEPSACSTVISAVALNAAVPAPQSL